MITNPVVRLWIYRIVAVVSLALAAGILSPLGPEVSGEVAKWIAFGNALVSGSAATLAAKNVNQYR